MMNIRNKADLWPVALSIITFTALISCWWFVDNTKIELALSLILFLPRLLLTTFVHNHSHLSTFRSKKANQLFEIVLFLLCGMMSSKFKLHHNIGHHKNYLDAKSDPSRWTYLSGKIMPRPVYILRYYTTHTYFSVKYGIEYRKLLNEYVLQQVVVLLVLAVLYYLKPVETLRYFIIPMTLAWMIFISMTYDDHVGLFEDDAMQASFTKTNKYINLLVFNNGYHLAHHLKPGLHWSELPAYHEKITATAKPITAHTAINKFSRYLERNNA